MPTTTSNPGPVLVWFRDELRLSDSRAWAQATQSGASVIGLFVDPSSDRRLRPLGGASRWWLHHALQSLGNALDAQGVPLLYFRGAADDLIPRLAVALRAQKVVWSRRYGQAERAIDSATKASLTQAGIAAESVNDRLLYEPWEVQPQSGGDFKVFTPFWKAATRTAPAAAVVPPKRAAQKRPRLPDGLGDCPLADLGLLPTKPDWAGGLRAFWTPGEQGAQVALDRFLDLHLKGYAASRDRPDLSATSALSPHLRFGEIGIRQIWQSTQRAVALDDTVATDANKFLAELGWREFSHHLYYHHDDLSVRCVQSRFEAFPWTENSPHLAAWQHGRTGFPIIDAGMRQLWHTGWMHNRVRMIVASFLVKHLLVDWRVGEAWFWDTLVDADPAANPASWQWVAGCGADAAPYFRIFNPELQGAKFDPDGRYVKTWVPELDGSAPLQLHTPRKTPEPATQYPSPIIDLAAGRERALAALETLPKSDDRKPDTRTPHALKPHALKP